MKQTDVRDVNNSDSGPWNIWCRNLIYFKSSTVLWLRKTKQWNFELRSELKVTVRVKNFSCTFWPVISGLGPVTLIWWHVSGGHWVSSLSLSSSHLLIGDRHAPIFCYQVISSSYGQIFHDLGPHERSARVNHRISNPLKMPIKSLRV